jgi:hypothetical protein
MSDNTVKKLMGMYRNIPLFFKSQLILRNGVEVLERVHDNTPDDKCRKEDNSNQLSSRNNPKWSFHNHWERPQPEPWMLRFIPG